VRLKGGDPAGIPAVADGRAGVQDEGSQYAALALAELLGNGSHDVLDLCAGPGGKAALLAGVLTGRLVTGDVHEHRARLVRDSLRHARGMPSLVVTADGRTPAWREASFDGVLLDAPCTGLGALRRRPEARWRRGPDDVAPLQELQRKLLDTAIRAVKPGGYVVYVVCSPHLAETHDVIATAQGADVLRTDQLWPHRNGTDAMYVARLRRIVSESSLDSA
jgi:16S rRNA (cytosine967-C5)-methyltransferase